MRRALIPLALAIASAVEPQELPRVQERITVEVVDLEVVALDERGLPVSDLRADDFEVRVNGERAEIVDFAPHFPAAVEKVPEESMAPGNIRAEDETQAPPRVWLVYVDLSRLSDFRRTSAIRDLQKFFASASRRGDRVMVGMFDGWTLRVPLPLTDRLESVQQALRVPAMRALPHRENPDLQLNSEDLERKWRAAIRALRDFTALAAGAGGRVTMLFVGAGYTFGDPQDPMSVRLWREYQLTRDAVAASGITIHSIYAWKDGVQEFGAQQSLEPGMPSMDGPAPDLSSIAEGSTMAVFAADTGGESLTAAPGLAERVEQADGKRSGYYSIAFRTPSVAAGSRLKIAVRVARDGVRVEHRRLVRLQTDAEASRNASMAALLTEQPANPAGIRVNVGALQRNRLSGFRAPLEIHIPAGRISFAEHGERRGAQLRFFAGVRDAKGNYSCFEANPLMLDVTEAEFQALLRNGIRYKLEIVVSPGTTDVAMTVADVAGRTNSTVNFKISAPGR